MLAAGQTIGRYRISRKLGQGGMGAVYCAHDATLGREVAIKVLPPELIRHAERIRRFSQEARAASALNHPNIVTVYDAGEFEEGPFLVMELVEGESLHAQLRRGPLPLPKLLDIGVQAAAALTRAQEAGITHRDLKPENILVRGDGYIKVLDFGLAKLRDKEPPSDDDSTATIEMGITSEGVIVGTAAYMSPEQATARGVDGRSDIFSLALVLFECWQGANPFRRTNFVDTLHAIVHDALPALDYPAGSAEWELNRILQKALAKETENRYQTMKDLGIDLRRLKQETGSGNLSSRPMQSSIRLQRLPVWYAAAILTLLAFAGAGALLLFRSRRPSAPPQVAYQHLTNFADSATSPALSPDGRMLAFIRGESTFLGPGQIYVKLLPDGEPLQLTDTNRDKMSPKFSPDGARLTYTQVGASGFETWVVPVLGGKPRFLLANAEGLTWIRGGVLFSEMTGRGQQMGIVTSQESRTAQRTVYMPPEESGMAHRAYLSPDGKQMLVVEMKFGKWLPCRLVPFDGSSAGKPVGPAPSQCTDTAWSPDGKWMYFSADTGGGSHIWRQPYPSGEIEQVTPSGATQEEGIEFALDGRSFVTSIGTSQSTLWIHDARGDRQITSEGFALLPSISADGKKIYYLRRAGGRSIVNGELWVADLESGQRERLLPDFLMRHYSISVDGQRLVFVASEESGKNPVWLAPLDRRSAPRRLTDKDARKAFFGPDGDVLFLGFEKETNVVYRVKADGNPSSAALPAVAYQGQQVRLAEYGLHVSPNGRWIVVGGPTEDMPRGLMVYAVSGGAPVLICENCYQAQSFERGPPPPYANWSADGKFFYLNFEGSTYAIPLSAGKALTPIPAAGIPHKGRDHCFARSPAARGGRISRTGAITLCFHEVRHSAQHLPDSCALTRSAHTSSNFPRTVTFVLRVLTEAGSIGSRGRHLTEG